MFTLRLVHHVVPCLDCPTEVLSCTNHVGGGIKITGVTDWNYTCTFFFLCPLKQFIYIYSAIYLEGGLARDQLQLTEANLKGHGHKKWILIY